MDQKMHIKLVTSIIILLVVQINLFGNSNLITNEILENENAIEIRKMIKLNSDQKDLEIISKTIPNIPNSSQNSSLLTDLILYNGTIITMDLNQPQVNALAISKDKIIGVGAKNDIFLLANDSTKKIDLNGKIVLPGFIDSHAHWIGAKNEQTNEGVIQLAIENGWTSISEMNVNEDDLNNLIKLNGENKLRLRVNAYLRLGSDDESNNTWYQSYSPGFEYSSKLRIGGVKIFSDSQNGSQMEIFFNQSALNNLVQEANNLGYQIAIHSWTEDSTDMVINAYETMIGNFSILLNRPRVEHLVMLRDDQIQSLSELGILASIQLPWFSSDWIIPDNVGLDFIGMVNYLHLARWRDILDYNVRSIGGF